MFLGHIDLNFWKFQTFVLIRVSQSWKVIFDRWSATYENIRQVAVPFECWFSNSSQTFTHFPDKKKMLKSPSSLNHTANLPKIFKKKIKFQRKSCKCFTDHRNSQTTWLRGMQKLSWNLDAMYKWAKSGETGRGSALKRCRGGFELTFILQGSSGWKDPLVPTSEFSASRFQQQKHFLFWMLLWSEKECVCYFNFLNFEATSLFSFSIMQWMNSMWRIINVIRVLVC